MTAPMGDGEGPTDRIGPWGWRPLLVLVAVAVVDQLMVGLTGGLLPLLQAEFGFSDTAGGAVESAEAIAAILVALPAGYLADRYCRVRLISFAIAGSAIAGIGSAVAPGLAVLATTRALAAVASGTQDPAASSLLGDYYPSRSRARAYGYQRMAFFAAGSLGVVLGGVCGQAFGWRAAFLLMVAPCLVAALLCRRLAEPRRGLLDRPADRGDEPGTAAPRGARPFLGQLRALLADAVTIRVYAGLAALFLGSSGFTFWMTSYYVRTFTLPLGTAATLVSLVDLVGLLAGTAIGAHLGDRFHPAVHGWRIRFGGAALLAGSLLLGIGLLLPALTAQLCAFAIGAFLLSTAIPALNAAIAELLPSDRRGTGFALLAVLAGIGFALGPPLVGVMSDTFGSLAAGFAVLTTVMAAGSLTVLTAPVKRDRHG